MVTLFQTEAATYMIKAILLYGSRELVEFYNMLKRYQYFFGIL